MPDGFELDATPAALSDVAGFKTGVAACGLKKSGPDVAVIFNAGSVGAAVFTRNLVAAAPVKLSRPRAKAGKVRAVVVNAGNANCCTGEQGLKDAEEMARLAAAKLGVPEEEVLVASTGVIGRVLDMAKVKAGVEAAAAEAKAGGKGDVAAAILTTDLARKAVSASGTLAGKPFRVAGIAKGSGMIAPNMATMLAFIVTDADASLEYISELLPHIADRTFNRVTVDGDTSTNDMFCVLASGKGKSAPVSSQFAEEGQVLAEAIETVARELAMAIARDGEGATKLVDVRVTGAATDEDAELAVKTIAESPLVKTAVHGGDPNWGRILAAAGRSGAKVDDALATVRIGDVAVFEKGTPVLPVPEAAAAKLAGKDVSIEIDLGLGDAEAAMWTCDLTKGYIEINAHYTT
ncbi:MAG: bifunctional glutamate N-acetyltransferase/amino-acid acetyltransferase ArgJ [Planctomycetota bacterium]|jgi:glutamate N-acetyltransferase/amino-acid N-acetyltransferase